LIEPAICKTTIGKPEDSLIKDNDAVIFFNYREDSARQITKAFIEPSFSKFERRELNNLYFCTMTKYLKSLPAHVAFEPPEINYPLGLVLAESGKRQLKIAETEKYAHVTFFFNGLREKPFIGEDRILIPSIPESQLEKSPEMSIKELSVQAQKAIRSGNYDFILINFANPDVLGHTGNLEACIKGLEIMDICLGEIKNAVLEMNGTMLITADHGNCEEMLNPYTGVPDTEHSINPVLFYVVNSDFKKEKTEQEIDWEQSEPHGFLSDIAPTILTMMNLPIPKEMTGKNLLPYIAKSL
jgi:2,3-bisphosphoglycerate-independent phosphoglycerate mutase